MYEFQSYVSDFRRVKLRRIVNRSNDKRKLRERLNDKKKKKNNVDLRVTVTRYRFEPVPFCEQARQFGVRRHSSSSIRIIVRRDRFHRISASLLITTIIVNNGHDAGIRWPRLLFTVMSQCCDINAENIKTEAL